jgi:regulator of CtrA degradation
MHSVAQHAPVDHQLLFLPGVFNETLSQLFDAHHYFQTRGIEDQQTVAQEWQMPYSNEMTRITMRLTSVMAWLMVRRAIHAGRIDSEKAAECYRLDGSEICLAHHDETLLHMPYYLKHLSERSLDLYERVYRLDRMVYGSGVGEAV